MIFINCIPCFCYIYQSSYAKSFFSFSLRNSRTYVYRGHTHTCAETAAHYDPEKLTSGYNTLPNGEKIYFIPNPALGLWIDRQRF